MFSLRKQSTQYTLAMLLGIACGIINSPEIMNIARFLSEAFMRMFKLVSLPIISLSLIVSVSMFSSGNDMAPLWKKTLKYSIATTFIAALVAAITYYIISPENVQTIANTAQEFAQHKITEINYSNLLLSNIPEGIIDAFQKHNVTGILLLSICCGISIRLMNDGPVKSTISNFFVGLRQIFFTFIRWIIKILPICIFGFICIVVADIKSGTNIKGIGSYVLVILIANIVQGAVILSLWLKSNGISPLKSFKGMSKALYVAFFAKSSTGALPVSMEVIEKELGVNPKVSRFVMPLCTTLNMNGCAAFIFTTVIFVMQNNGMPITIDFMVLWVVIATIAALGNAGIPMGCFILSASLLSTMNADLAIMGMILPLYSFLDMIETALNTWSDSCVTLVVNKKVTK